MGYLLALTSAMFFSLSEVCFRSGLKNREALDKYTGLFLTILINNINNMLALGVLFLVKPVAPPTGKGVAFFILAGMCTSFFGRMLLFFSIERVGAARAANMKITAPLFALVVGVLFLKEIPSPAALMGIGIVLTGMFLISRETNKSLGGAEENKQDSQETSPGYLTMGVFIGILAGLCFGVGSVLRKVGVGNYNEPIIGASLGSFMALLLITAVLIYKKNYPSYDVLAQKELLKGYFLGGIFTSLAQYTLFYSLSFIPVAVASSFEAMGPLFILLISYLFLKGEEVITRKITFISTAIVVGVLMIVLL
ncbi:MAG TPA: DMT family transporter [Firmicutes bacterium]|nr:DMT family transporter [Bacillota bacterium]